MWFKNKKHKIDDDIIKYHFSNDIDIIKHDLASNKLGLGYVNIPHSKWKYSKDISATKFKNQLNKYFREEIKKLGFEGKDYKYYKDFQNYSALINISPWRYDGGFQVDLLVKILEIKYPPNFENFKPGRSLKYCEFSKRLAPINIKVWVWPYEDSEGKIRHVFDEVIRLIKTKGLQYFEQFNNLEKIVSEIDISFFQNNNPINYQDSVTGFPSNGSDFYLGSLPSNYFIFEFSRLNKNHQKAIEHAKFGLTQKGIMDGSKVHLAFHEIYNQYLEEMK